MNRQCRNSKSGFTLIELLVVIAIIAVLIGLLLPAVQKVRAAAQRAQCGNNIKQQALALQSYHDANQAFPPGQTNTCVSIPGSGANPDMSWQIKIFPFMEQTNLYNAFLTYCAGGGAVFYFTNDNIAIKSLVCPSDPLGGTSNWNGFYSNYVGNSGTTSFDAATTATNGVLCAKSNVRMADITDGTSNTLMVGEIVIAEGGGSGNDVRGTVYNPWQGNNLFGTAVAPNTSNPDVQPGTNGTYCVNVSYAPCSGATAQTYNGTSYTCFISSRSKHPGGVNCGLVDGSVRFVTNSINANTWLNAGSRAGGEVLGSNW